MDKSTIDEMDLYYQTLEERPDIGWFLQGHLVVEHLLRRRLIEKGTDETKIQKMGFFSITSKCFEGKIINKKQKEALLFINRIRNKYAHELTYKPSLSEWIDLWKTCQIGFSDQTDGIEQGLEELNSVEKLEDADRFHLNELFVQICHDI